MSGILFSIEEVSRLTIKDNVRYIYDFLKAVGNNIRASSLFNAAVAACFWYFDNNIFSVITPLSFNKVNVSSIQISMLHSWVLSTIFFSTLKPKGEFNINFVFEYQHSVKSNQIRMFGTVVWIKCLPPKMER